jgi:hypothetical protein
VEAPGPEIDADTILFRTVIDGNHASLWYALEEGTWIPLGGAFTLTFGRWRGDRLGFYCWNDRTDAGHVDIDWFRYEHDGPLGGLG